MARQAWRKMFMMTGIPARASCRFSVAVFAKAEVRENAARSRVNCASPGSKSGEEPPLNLNKPRRNVDTTGRLLRCIPLRGVSKLSPTVGQHDNFPSCQQA